MNVEPGLHYIQTPTGEFVMIIICSADALNTAKNLDKEQGWYWAQESDKDNFHGPFKTTRDAMIAAATLIQGHDPGSLEENAIEIPFSKVFGPQESETVH